MQTITQTSYDADAEAERGGRSILGTLPEGVRPFIESFSVSELTEKIVEADMTGPLVEHAHDAALASAIRAATLENTAAFKLYLMGTIDPDLYVPAQSIRAGAIVAQLQISQSDVQKCGRATARVLSDHWSSCVQGAAAEGEIGVAEAIGAIQTFTRALLTWQDRVFGNIAAAMSAEQEALRASKASLRQQLLGDVVRGDLVLSEGELSAALLYDVPLHHCAIILPGCSESRAREVVASLRAATKVANYITLSTGAAGTAVWLGRFDAWSPRVLTTVRQALTAQEVDASIGTPARGLDGFLSTFRHAERVEEVRRSWGALRAPAVMAFEDVGLESLLNGNAAAAREFVLAELGGLAADSHRAAEMRHTVLVWFETCSHTSAAASLNVHEHTVRNRLRRVEDLIGHPLTTRRAELQVALRLYPAFGPEAVAA